MTGEIDISSGFHIALEDGVTLTIALFSEDVSDITFTGGSFEFLPITAESAGVVISDVLAPSMHAGFSLATPDNLIYELSNDTLELPSMSGDVDVSVSANVAEFSTNVTVAPEGQECELEVVQSYQLALGAAAGATVAIDTHTWDPVYTTSTAIWYTELGTLCAIKSTAALTSTTTQPHLLAVRQLSLQTTTSEVTIT
ncbi:MAG: hypothetical protein Q9191_008329 [Dirinaria sp. TL-2023a]